MLWHQAIVQLKKARSQVQALSFVIVHPPRKIACCIIFNSSSSMCYKGEMASRTAPMITERTYLNSQVLNSNVPFCRDSTGEAGLEKSFSLADT